MHTLSCTDTVMEFSLQAADLSKPIDKRIYKGTQPTCHDFNHLTATAESVSLLVGFSAGQVQLIDPIKKETSKLFNEEVHPLKPSVYRLFFFISRLICDAVLMFSFSLFCLSNPNDLLPPETHRQVQSDMCEMGARL